jgi:hypothetical protein
MEFEFLKAGKSVLKPEEVVVAFEDEEKVCAGSE